MRILLTGILLLLCTPTGDSGERHAQATATVWVCGGPKSKRYHSHRNCSGLKKCSKTPKRIERDKARSQGYTACKKCY